jgi:hypothetical protein
MKKDESATKWSAEEMAVSHKDNSNPYVKKCFVLS